MRRSSYEPRFQALPVVPGHVGTVLPETKGNPAKDIPLQGGGGHTGSSLLILLLVKIVAKSV